MAAPLPKKQVIDYKPPPTIKEFIRDYRSAELFYDWIVGPVGSGKTTALFFKLIFMAKKQAPGPDGIRRSRAVVVRNTAPQLRDTTLVSWNYWFKHGVAGEWKETAKTFTLRFADVECEVLFRPLDTPEDVARVLSLEVTFALIDEFVQIPKEIIEALSGRLGRFPGAKDGGATNWGMWGSSNPDTEDNWWFDYLHNPAQVERVRLPWEIGVPDAVVNDPDAFAAAKAMLSDDAEKDNFRNVKYFKQPSGFSPEAENIEFLPGKRAYYTNLAKGKTTAWIKQFLESEWGFSISGKPVVPSFNAGLHVSKSRLKFNPHLPLVIGYDPGMAGSALIFGQEDLHGRLLVLAELVQINYSTERLVIEKLKPFLRTFFPEARVIIAPDPAAANRSQSDAKTSVDILKRHFEVKAESNNRFPLRLNAIEHYTSRLTDAGPALVIDGLRCPELVRGLKGGWRYVIDQKKDTVTTMEPEKNKYSHPCDGFGYLCRYFHRLTEREMRYGSNANKKLQIPRSFSPSYHMR